MGRLRPGHDPGGLPVHFSETDSLLQETFRRFALERLLPDYLRWQSEPFPADLRRELAEIGVMGLSVPEEYGGSASTYVQLGIAAEELARGDFNVASFLQLNAIASMLLGGADESLKRRWLPAVASGEATIAFALTEPEVGSDAARLRTRAVREGDDFVITGEKASITFAGYADLCLVFARSGGEGARGISLFAVPLDLPGVSRQVYPSPGGRMTSRGSLHCDDVRIPADHQIGAEGTGFIGAMKAFDFNRAVIALACVGAAAQSLDETVEYAKNREAFGRPIARHEGVAFQIAEHLTRVHAARLLAYEVMELADSGEPHTTQAAMCKWYGPKVSAEAIHACVVLHGWPGYGSDLPLMQRMNDVIGLEIGDGTPEIMKGIISREVMGREYTAYR